jgi:DNA-binding LacI/PurR family transcriptional regulator
MMNLADLLAPTLKRLELAGLPILFHGSAVHVKQTARVFNLLYDEAIIARTAISYLASKKYTHLCVVRFHEREPFKTRQNEICTCGHLHFGQAVSEVPFRTGAQNKYSRLQKHLAGLPKGAAVLCPNDQSAGVSINLLHNLGRACPGDIAVMGINNQREICSALYPTLTSTEIFYTSGAEKAYEMLIDLVSGKTLARINYCEIKVIERESA